MGAYSVEDSMESPSIVSAFEMPWLSPARPLADTSAESLYGCMYMDTISQPYVDATEEVHAATDLCGLAVAVGARVY